MATLHLANDLLISKSYTVIILELTMQILHHFDGLVQEQGKSKGFDSFDRPSNLTQTGFKSLIFSTVWPGNLMDDLEKL